MIRRTTVAYFCLLVFGVPVLAADKVIEQLPQGTVMAVQVRGVERTRDRLVAMVKEIDPAYAQAAQDGVDQFRSQLFEGRELKGVKKDGRMILALPEFPLAIEALASGVLLVETADYTVLRDSVGGKTGQADVTVESKTGYDVVKRGEQTMYFVKRGQYTAITEDVKSAEALAKQKDPFKATEHISERFERGDVGLFIDMVAVNREFGDAIKQFRDQFAGLVELAAASQAGGDPEQAKQQAETMRNVFNGIFTFIEDTRAVVGSASFEQSGLALSFLAEVATGTSTSELFSKFKPSTNQHIAKLPEGSHVYLEFSGSPEMFKALGDYAATMVQQFGPATPNASQLEKLQTAGPGNVAVAMSIGGGINLTSINTYEKPNDAIDAMLASTEELAKNKQAMLKEVKVERQAGEHRGIKLSKIELKYDLEAISAQPGAQAGADQVRALMGEGMTMYLGVKDKTVFQISAKDLEAAKAKLDQLLDQKAAVGTRAGVVEALKQLPTKNTAIVLLDLPSFFRAIFQQMMGFGGLNVGVQAPPVNPSYLGIAVVTEPNEFELAFWVPTQSVVQLIQTFQGFGGAEF